MGIYLLPHVRGHRKHTLPLAKKKKKKKDRHVCNVSTKEGSF